MPKIALTDVTIRALKPPPKGQVDYWDTSFRTFGVRVSQGGSKTFILMKEGSRESLGRYGPMTLAKAREEARKRQATYTLRQGKQASIPFQEALNLFVELHCKKNNKPRSAAETERVLCRCFGHLTCDVSDVAYADISEVTDKLGPGAANHAFTAIRTLLNWCLQRQYISTHPLIRAKLPHRLNSRDRFLTDEELVQVWRAAQEFYAPMCFIIGLLITTGQRVGEMSGLRWSWIDKSTRIITLPPEITKNSERHAFPYGSITQDILDTVESAGDLLFPAPSGERAFSSHSCGMRRFAKVCPLPHWTLHDLRRTFSTIQARLGTPPHVTEALLNHKTGTRSPIQRIYDRHTYFPEMTAAMKRYDEYLTTLFSRA